MRLKEGAEQRASPAMAGGEAEPSLKARFFSFRGRAPRGAFLLASFLLGIAFVGLFVLLDHTVGHGATLVLYPPFFWSLAALLTQRLHDRGKSPLRLLLLLVPLLGPLWLAVELCALPGTAAENRYGGDPLRSRIDYQVVA
jgi:uncharacterized membrane protein YhaH (DUF805 family)